jgi:hypothetical protein
MSIQVISISQHSNPLKDLEHFPPLSTHTDQPDKQVFPSPNPVEMECFTLYLLPSSVLDSLLGHGFESDRQAQAFYIG